MAPLFFNFFCFFIFTSRHSLLSLIASIFCTKVFTKVTQHQIEKIVMKNTRQYTIIISLLLSSLVYADNCQDRWDDILEDQNVRQEYQSLIGLCGDNFKRALRGVIDHNQDLGYTRARTVMFSELDNFGGRVCGVYSGKCLNTDGIPNHQIMNCEHSWPQSMGAVGIAKSDLHHLYPADSRMNSRRSNHPFCEVITSSWQDYGSALGRSYSGVTCFEPPDHHKGNVARSMFYFSIRYQKNMGNEQESFFRSWITSDPVDENEIERNEMIQYHQGNRNPFIDHPEFITLF